MAPVFETQSQIRGPFCRATSGLSTLLNQLKLTKQRVYFNDTAVAGTRSDFAPGSAERGVSRAKMGFVVAVTGRPCSLAMFARAGLFCPAGFVWMDPGVPG